MNKHISIPELNFQMEFIYVRPGTFMMGSPETEENRCNDEVLHEVTISKPFYLGKYPVTQNQYEALTGDNRSYFKGANFPVENISWPNSIEFCIKLQKVTGYRFWLPTEAQWEYACRAGTTTPFSFGSELNGTQANCDGNLSYGTLVKGPYLRKTSAVGSYPANAWGFYDMHGNVWEWCSDRYGPYENKKVTDPQGPTEGRECVLRGGGWVSCSKHCRAANRAPTAFFACNRSMGFRVCLNFT